MKGTYNPRYPQYGDNMRSINNVKYALACALIQYGVIAQGTTIGTTGQLIGGGNTRTLVVQWSSNSSTPVSGNVTCASGSDCFVAPVSQWTQFGAVRGWYLPQSMPRVTVSQGTPWETALALFRATWGTSGTGTGSWTVGTGNNQLVQVCMGAQPTDFNTSNIAVLPPYNSCSPINPGPVTCSTSGALVVLDHRELNPGNAHGHSVTQNVSVDCTGPVTARVDNPAGNGPIVLGPDITSTLTFDGQALGTAMIWGGGNTVHTVTSTLGYTGTLGGAFQTPSVLRINIL